MLEGQEVVVAGVHLLHLGCPKPRSLASVAVARRLGHHLDHRHPQVVQCPF